MNKDEKIRRASSAVRAHLFALGLQVLLLSCFAPGVSLSFAKGNTPKGLACLALGEKTACVAFTAPTGFVLCDYSSCVRPENYDQEIGATLCKDGIKDDLWTLLGFVLQWADHGLKK